MNQTWYEKGYDMGRAIGLEISRPEPNPQKLREFLRAVLTIRLGPLSLQSLAAIDLGRVADLPELVVTACHVSRLQDLGLSEADIPLITIAGVTHEPEQ